MARNGRVNKALLPCRVAKAAPSVRTSAACVSSADASYVQPRGRSTGAMVRRAEEGCALLAEQAVQAGQPAVQVVDLPLELV